MSKLQRTDKQLTEQDAIELGNALTGLELEFLGEGNFYHLGVAGNDHFCLNILSKTLEYCPSRKLMLDGHIVKYDSLAFTNKALERGLYEIVE